jgi:uncharacterized protein (TIRG00374 family)
LADNMPRELKKSRSAVVNSVVLAVGLVLFIFLLVRLDARTIAAQLQRVGPFFVGAFLCYVANLFFGALTWRATIEPRHSQASVMDLWQAFWAGHAINAVTPAGGAGEFLKASLLRGKLEGRELATSLILYNGINAAVTAGVAVLGAVICFVFLDVPRDATGVVLGGSTVVLVLFLLLLWWIRSGAASHVVHLAKKLPFVRIDDDAALTERAAEIDRRMRVFMHERPAALTRAVFFCFCVRLFQVAETGFLLYPLMPGEEIVLIAILMQTASQLIVWIAAFVPAKIGVLEGGNAGLFKLAGLDPATAFTVVLAKRLRMVLGIAIGLALGSRFVGDRTSYKPRPEDP